ncbi:hypothetical protein FACS1894211_16460 [Clostridia bacterium]|nr:hypothetical protein FACS1894211_16460 [Clostridia bacterium]
MVFPKVSKHFMPKKGLQTSRKDVLIAVRKESALMPPFDLMTTTNIDNLEFFMLIL